MSQSDWVHPFRDGNCLFSIAVGFVFQQLDGIVAIGIRPSVSPACLYAYLNSLAGVIPSELGALSSLDELYLYLNNLEGLSCLSKLSSEMKNWCREHGIASIMSFGVFTEVE